MADRLRFPTDHQAEAPLEPEDAAAGADVDVVDPLRTQGFGPVDVVAVVRVAAVDDDVALGHQPGQLIDGVAREGGGHHHPGRLGRLQLGHELLEGAGARRPLVFERLDGVGVDVIDDAAVPASHQPPHQVGAHAP